MIRIFIMSSTEGLAYAETLKALLEEKFKNLDYEMVLWTSMTMSKGGVAYLNSLEQQLAIVYGNGKDTRGYAVAMLTPDDDLVYRKKNMKAPRDNVIFEYGMSVGKLGSTHSFTVSPNEKCNLRKPSDVDGITDARYMYIKYAKAKNPKFESRRRCLLQDASERIFDWVTREDKEILPDPIIYDKQEDLEIVNLSGGFRPSY